MDIDNRKAKLAFSSNPNIDEAIKEIKNKIGNGDYNLIMFFASPTFLPDVVSAKIYDAFDGVPTIGCSTVEELFEGEILKNSIVLMAFDKSIIKQLSIAVVPDLGNLNGVNKAFDKFDKDLGINSRNTDSSKYVGVILSDGLSVKTNALMDRINDVTNINFVGGAAGDNWMMKHTYVYCNGKYYENAAVLAFLEPTVGFMTFKTLAFKPMGRTYKVTRADPAKRCIYTIENQPAVKFYADQLGKTVEETIRDLEQNTMGIMIFNEAYVHDPSHFGENNVIYLFSSVPQNAEVQILEATDIIKETKSFVSKNLTPLKHISAMLSFTCANRTKRALKQNVLKEFGEIFKDFPMVGFGTYGEYYFSFMNQTSIILVFL